MTEKRIPIHYACGHEGKAWVRAEVQVTEIVVRYICMPCEEQRKAARLLDTAALERVRQKQEFLDRERTV